MSTNMLSYESVNIPDLTRLLRHSEALLGSLQQLLDCKRDYTNLPTPGFVTPVDQKQVAFSLFVADFNAVRASMHWLVHNSKTTSAATQSVGDSSTPTGENQLTGDTGIRTHPWLY